MLLLLSSDEPGALCRKVIFKQENNEGKEIKRSNQWWPILSGSAATLPLIKLNFSKLTEPTV